METSSPLKYDDLAGIGLDRLRELTEMRPIDRVIIKIPLLIGPNQDLLRRLPKRERGPERAAQIEAAHVADMQAKGLAPVRPTQADSGIRAVNNAVDVQIGPAAVALFDTGDHVLSDIFWWEDRERPGKAFLRIVITSVRAFGRPAVEVDGVVHKVVVNFLSKMTFGFVHVWSNLNRAPDGVGVIRSESWNLNILRPNRVAFHKDPDKRIKAELHLETGPDGGMRYRLEDINR